MLKKITEVKHNGYTFKTYSINKSRDIITLAENSLGNENDDITFTLEYYLYIVPASFNNNNEISTINYNSMVIRNDNQLNENREFLIDESPASILSSFTHGFTLLTELFDSRIFTSIYKNPYRKPIRSNHIERSINYNFSLSWSHGIVVNDSSLDNSFS